jgi:hypothetical protein
MEPLPPGRPPLDVIAAVEQIEVRRIGPPPIILAPPPRQLTAAPTATKRAPRRRKASEDSA